MKSVTLAEVQTDLEAVLDSAQKERIVITRAGKPSAVIVGIEGYDDEDLRWANSPEFWRMIEERRAGPSIPFSEVKARLEARERSRKPPKPTTGSRRKKQAKPRNLKP